MTTYPPPATTPNFSTFQEFHSPSQQNEEEGGDFDLRAYWLTFNKYKWRIILLTVLIGILAKLFSMTLVPVYRTSATILLELSPAQFISVEDRFTRTGMQMLHFQTQARVITSRKLAEQVAERLDLTHADLAPKKQYEWPEISFSWREWIPKDWLGLFPEPQKAPVRQETDDSGKTNPGETGESSQPGAGMATREIDPLETPVQAPKKQVPRPVGAIMRGLNVRQISGTQLVGISFETYNPKLAPRVVNTLVEVYVESDLEARMDMTEKASTWLMDRLEEYRIKLQESEQKLQDYLARQDLIGVSGNVQSFATEQLSSISSSLLGARQTLAQKEISFRQLQELEGRPFKDYISHRVILSNSQVQSIKQQRLNIQSEIAELSKRYGPKHPKMIEANNELEIVEDNLKQQVREAIHLITQEYETARARVRALEQSKREAEQQVTRINRGEHMLTVLERDVESNRQLYNTFLTRFKETDVSEAQAKQSTIARVIEEARVPGAPYKPDTNKIVMQAVGIGFVLVTLLAFLLEYLNNTLKNATDVEQKLGVPLLGTLPVLKTSRKDIYRPHHAFLSESQSSFAEAIRTVRTGVMLSNLDNPHKIILVTSTVPGEGKTVFAINQAFALSQMKKTLLIDADMRRPTIAKVFGLQAKAPGLSNMVAGTETIDTCIHPQELEGVDIDVVPSGTIPPNPLELLSSLHFKQLLEQLEQRYEQIVIDSPPSTLVSDALVLGKYAKAVVYVVKADETPYQLVQNGLKRLRQFHAPVLGVVLNQADLRKTSNYYYGYKYGRRYASRGYSPYHAYHPYS